MSIINKDNLKLDLTSGKVFCDSRELAKQFDKLHKNVLAKIEEEIERFGGLKNSRQKIKEYFVKSDYIDSRGKTYIRYLLTFKGFQQIALQFTGKKAFTNRIKFIEFFEELLKIVERDKIKQIANKLDVKWVGFREASKEARLELTEAIKKYVIDVRTYEEKKLNDGRYYQHYSNLINKKLNIILPKGVTEARSVVDKKTLARLTVLEYDIADLIIKYSKQNIHYREVYKMIKKEILG